jgi:hypothetical protein
MQQFVLSTIGYRNIPKDDIGMNLVCCLNHHIHKALVSNLHKPTTTTNAIDILATWSFWREQSRKIHHIQSAIMAQMAFDIAWTIEEAILFRIIIHTSNMSLDWRKSQIIAILSFSLSFVLARYHSSSLVRQQEIIL